MGYSTYPEYVPIENIIGTIPLEWRTERLYDVAELRTSNVDKKSVEGQAVVKLCNYVDVYYNSKITSGIKFMVSTASKREIKRFSLQYGDVVFTKDSEDPFDIGIPTLISEDIDGLVCGYHLTLIRPDISQLLGEFAYYALEAELSKFQFTLASNGVTRFGLTFSGTKNIKICIPSIKEQQQIAKFLDYKTNQIDQLIAKKKALIEKLNEKRIAVITKAVTKGLDPTVPMRDSEVEWLGEVPAHWDIIKLRYCTSLVTSGSRGWAKYFSNNGGIFLRITNLDRDSIELLTSDLQRVQPPSGSEGERTQTKAGDILISITADLGSVAVIPPGYEASFVSQHISLVRPESDKVLSEWLAFTVFSHIGKTQLLSSGYGGTKQQLSLGDIKKFVMLRPPSLEEQRTIVVATKEEISKIDEMISLTNQTITHLTEYRTALITTAVTGKIDVRDVKVPQEA